MKQCKHDIAIVVAGITGIATAYYLLMQHGVSRIALIDRGEPMSFTSAQSGENYRNWWPHPAMTALTNRSIDLLEDIALASDNRINMVRRGYALVTRRTDIDALLQSVCQVSGKHADNPVRFHDTGCSNHYTAATTPDWQTSPNGIDVLQDPALIRKVFPSYAADIGTVIHIRRGGSISGQQLGMYMLDILRHADLKQISASVEAISTGNGFCLELSDGRLTSRLFADRIVNAAGPFAARIAQMTGVELPLYNLFQQKICFEDTQRVIPRDMPFSIDLDGQHIDWSAEERELLADDPALTPLTRAMPGGIHCRPEGGDHGRWMKLGWAYNSTPAEASRDVPLDSGFPEIVLRGAARLNPGLKAYYDGFPRNFHHYGGWYTMTRENWPLIGPMGPAGAFMNCAHSGFGTMAACAAGELAAAWVADAPKPPYSQLFSQQRHQDAELMHTLHNGPRGLL